VQSPADLSRLRLHSAGKVFPGICTAAMEMYPMGHLQPQSRPSSETEPQRLHCEDMINIAEAEQECARYMRPWSEKEGQFAWYLQGNRVARGVSTFSGEMVPRYTIVWSSESNPNPRSEGNEGSGDGQGFVDSLQQGDWIVIWARAKVSRTTCKANTKIRGLTSLAEARLGKPRSRCPHNHSLHDLIATALHRVLNPDRPPNRSFASKSMDRDHATWHHFEEAGICQIVFGTGPCLGMRQ
jgi:hypothetical protein